MMDAGSTYREFLTEWGQVVTIKRILANQPDQTLGTARARIMGYKPEEIAAGIDAGRRRVIVLAEDIASYNPPLRKNDRIVTSAGAVLVIERVDASTRKIGDTVLAYECEASGAAS